MEAAAGYFQQSLLIRRETQDRRGEGVSRWTAAEGYFQQSQLIRRETQDRQGEGVDGQIDAEMDAEIEHFHALALPFLRETQDRRGEGVVLSSLGQAALRRGQLEAAEGYFQQSLLILRETQDRQGEGVDLADAGAGGRGARPVCARGAGLPRGHRGAARGRRPHQRRHRILEALGAVLLRHNDDPAGGCAAYAEAIALWQAIGLADREQQAREQAIALGCDPAALPGEGNAAR